MATPARKLKSDQTPDGERKPKYAPSILRLVKDSKAERQGQPPGDADRSQTEGSRSSGVGSAPSIGRLNREGGQRRQGPQSSDTYRSPTAPRGFNPSTAGSRPEDAYRSQTAGARDIPRQGPQPQDGYRSQTTPPGFKVPTPPRGGLQDTAFQAGRGVGEVKKAWRKGEDRKKQQQESQQQNPNQGGPEGLDFNKIANAATSGDPRNALGEALTQLGAGKGLGDALFIIWGLLVIVSGVIPILGLFQASGVLIIFNLLLVSPKTVYRITELILDLIGVGEVLQVLDKSGLGRTKITIRPAEKLAIGFIDLGFVIWHGIFIFGMIVYMCSSFNVASKIPLFGSALTAGASSAEALTGLPIKQFCQSVGYGGDSPNIGNPQNTGQEGNGTCEVVHNPASGCDVNKLASACDWNASSASQVCNKESAGGTNPAIGGTADYCYPYGPDGKKFPMSIGYFQINIFNSYAPEFTGDCKDVLVNTGCWVDLVTLPGTNIKYCPKRKCNFGPAGEAGYNRCVQALSNGDRNTKQACNLYHQSHNTFQPWSAAKVCGIVK